MYQWRRYLCPLRESYKRTDEGYLILPNHGPYRPTNEHLVSLAELRNLHLVVIFGEPGIGKSQVLAQEATSLRDTGVYVIEEKLALFHSASELDNELLNRDEFALWRDGQGELYVFLDGLDEAQFRPDLLISALARKLQGQDLGRLFLRIASRTEVWQDDLEKPLAMLWDLAEFPSYTVAVLSREDVATAVQANAIDPDAFLQVISDREVEALAAVPLTLRLILAIQHQHGELPASRTDIYLEGCLTLCQYGYHHQASVVTPEERVVIAEYLAATSLFAQHPIIDATLPKTPLLDLNSIHIDELVNSPEFWQGRDIILNEHSITETLRTGLFSSSQGDKYIWGHRSFQEFLAARYLQRHNLPLTQLNSLLNAPLEPLGKYPPQLQSFIGWLVTLIPALKTTVILRDPVALLGGDSVALDDGERAQLVDSFLAALDEGRHLQTYREQRFYHKLCHPDLAQQLIRHLNVENHTIETQQAIVDIAEQCELATLQEFFLNRALDTDINMRLRLDAAAFIEKLGDDATKARLRPLLSEDAQDPRNELKALAIRALWPAHLSVQELFASLSPIYDDSVLTLYHSTVAHYIHPRLTASDLPVALAWVEQHLGLEQPLMGIESLADEIISLAIQHCDLPLVRAALVGILLAKFDNGHEIYERRRGIPPHYDEIALSEWQRRSLFPDLLAKRVQQKRDIQDLLQVRPHLLTADDFSWLAIELYPTLTKRQRRALTEILPFTCDKRRPEQVELAYNAGLVHKPIWRAFRFTLGPINIKSSVAERMRRIHRLEQEADVPQVQRVLPAQELQIASLLTRIEEGDVQLYWRLDLELTYDPKRDWHWYEFTMDISKLPGWIHSDLHVQERIYEAAKNYILLGDPHNEEWFGDDYSNETYDRRALAGYRALLLAYDKQPQFLEQLSPEIWSRWLPSILTTPNTSAIDISHHHLIGLAHNAAHDEFIAGGLVVLRRAKSPQTLEIEARNFDDVWEDAFSALLWKALVEHPIDLEYFINLLPLLFTHDQERSVEVAVNVLGNSIKIMPPEVRTRFAVELLYAAPNAGWDTVWPLIEVERKLGYDVLAPIASRTRYKHLNWLTTVDLPRLKSLLDWLITWSEENPRTVLGSGFRKIGPVDHLYDLMRMLEDFLMSHGSQESVAILKHMQEQHPNHQPLEWAIYWAQENLRKAAWQPTAPKELIALVRNRSLRLVRDADDLMIVILESLARLNAELQGEVVP